MDIDPREIDAKYGEPVNRLFLAINHYVSTGDHIGEGIAMPERNKMRVMIAVNTAMEQDKKDFEAFKAKFNAIKDKFGLTLDDGGSQGLFHLYSILLDESQMDPLAEELTKSPGPNGWGSPKKIIDQHF